MRNCNKIRAFIDLYLDGNADYLQTKSLFSHIETCARCRAKLEESQRLHGTIKSLSNISPPSYLRNSIISRIQTDGMQKGTESYLSKYRANFIERQRIFSFPISVVTSILIVIMVILYVAVSQDKPKTNLVRSEIHVVSPKEDSVTDQRNVDISAVVAGNGANEIKVILDGEDVTDYTEINSDFLIYTSNALKDGHHKVVSEVADNKGRSLAQHSWKFLVIGLEDRHET